MREETWQQTTEASTGVGSTIIQVQGTGACQFNHMWTFSAGTNTVSEGTPCDCGAVKYEKPKCCDKCGHLLVN